MTTKEIESEFLLNRDKVPSQELIHNAIKSSAKCNKKF